MYVDLVQQAVNLNVEEKETYLEGLYEDCGIPSDTDQLNMSWNNRHC